MAIKNVIPDDYAPPPQDERTVWAAGNYITTAIRWVSLNDEKQPIFVEKNGRMAAYCHLLIQGKEEGPPLSVEPGGIPLLVRAYGGDPTKLPSLESDYTGYLVAAQKLAKGKVVKVTVSDKGWVKNVPGMEVPEGLFRIVLESIGPTGPNGGPEPRKHEQYGYWFMPVFRIVGDVTGKPTTYNGAVCSEVSSYGIVADGNSPAFETKAEGTWTSNAFKMNKFIKAFAPEILHDVASFSDPFNILPEIQEIALRDKHVVVAHRQRSAKSGRVSFDLATCEATGETVTQEPEKPVEKQTIEYLYKAIDEGTAKEHPEAVAFDAAGKLVGEGKVWAGAHMVPACDRFHIEKKFSLISDDEALILLMALDRADLVQQAYNPIIHNSDHIKSRLDTEELRTAFTKVLTSASKTEETEVDF